MGTIVMIACIILFYRAAEMDGSNGVIWAILSVIVWNLTPSILGLGIVDKVLGQVGLFFGIAIFRIVWEDVQKRRQKS